LTKDLPKLGQGPTRDECERGISPRRPSISRYQISFKHCEENNLREYYDQLRHEFKRTTSQGG
jgi:hypothetical protein